MTVLDLDRRTIADALDVMAHGRASEDRSRPVRDYANGRVLYDLHAREVYSYGRHFPLFRFVPRGRRRPLVVLNGDVWRNGGGPSRTGDHQTMSRDLARELGAETVVIPFSALAGAGIDIDSIRPLAVRDDAQWEEEVVRPPHRTPEWRRRERVGVERTATDLEDLPAGERRSWREVDGRYQYGDRPCDSDGLYRWTEYVWRPVPPDPDGMYRWQEWRHRLGDCVFSAVREESYLRPARPFEVSRDTPRARFEVAWRETYCNVASSGAHETGPGGACIHCTRPLQTRVTVRQRARYLSSFDYNEPSPLYFLAELPRGADVSTVEAAIESLAPRAVHAARAREMPVERQGDVFFIRTGLTDAGLEARGIRSRARLTMWTRGAKPRKGETGYVGETVADRRARLARYARLRRSEYRRIREEQWASPLVQKKASRDYRVWNSSDEAYLTDGNRARAAWWRATEIARAACVPPEQRPSHRETVRRAVAIYGTAHTATEVVRTGAGTYVRGTVRHVPELEPNRTGAPDHRPLVLDPDCWYLAVRNTVPRQRGRRR